MTSQKYHSYLARDPSTDCPSESLQTSSSQTQTYRVRMLRSALSLSSTSPVLGVCPHTRLRLSSVRIQAGVKDALPPE